MTQMTYWRTDAPITSELYDRHAERLQKLQQLLSDLEKEGVYLKDVTVYVDGVEWVFDRAPRDFGDVWTAHGGR